MENITPYVAFDGTKFDNEKECLIWEERLTLGSPYLKLYDIDGNPLTTQVSFDDVYFIIVNDAEAGMNYFNYWEKYGRETPANVSKNNSFPIVGLWYYMDDEWKRWETEVKKLRLITDKFHKLKK